MTSAHKGEQAVPPTGEVEASLSGDSTPVRSCTPSRCQKETPVKSARPLEIFADGAAKALPRAAEFVGAPPGLDLGKDGRAEEAADESGQSRSATPANAQRNERILQLLREALSSKEATTWFDKDGFVPITRLLRLRAELQRETFGSTRVVAHAVEGQAAKAVRLDKARRRVRLQSLGELIRATAEGEISAADAGKVPLQALLKLPELRELLAREADPQAVVRRALEHEESMLAVRGGFVERRPRSALLCTRAEELFSDSHLSQDSRLRAKIADSPAGEVPLTWLCTRYLWRLGGHASPAAAAGARSVEVSAAELCDALKGSSELVVDPKRLTARRRAPARPADAASSPTGAAAAVSVPGKSAGGASRAAQQLRQLLDFYFEPFTLQHNRYLLDLVSKCVGPAEEGGPWVPSSLRAFRCGLEDLSGLGRVSAALHKLRSGQTDRGVNLGSSELGQLRHLSADSDGRLRLAQPPEVRSFVQAGGGAPRDAFRAVVRYLASAREQRGVAPAGTVSVTSYSVAAPMADKSALGTQRCAKLKRQLLVHHTDLVCLQGFDPESEGHSASLAEALLEEGYGFLCARSGSEANSIFWDRGRWELIRSHEVASGVSVDLRPFEDPSATLRAACLNPRVPSRTTPSLKLLFKNHSGPLVVCADLERLGGAEGAAVVEELALLPSVAQEVLGEDILVPVQALPDASGEPVPQRAASSGLNKLRSPDAMLFDGMDPIAVLSGHTEGYLATMPSQEVVQQFPAFRMPIVAAYDWSVRPEATPPSPAIAQSKVFRI